MINLSNNQDYQQAEASGGEYKKITAGGYVIRITRVEDHPDKEYLKLIYDIANGEFQGYYSDDFFADKDSAHCVYMSYKPSAFGMFKGRMAAIEESNNGYSWEDSGWNEATLQQLVVGAIIGEEEYIDRNDGKLKTSFKVRTLVPVQKILSGDFTVPEKKTVSEIERINAGLNDLASATSIPKVTASVYDEDIPF